MICSMLTPGSSIYREIGSNEIFCLMNEAKYGLIFQKHYSNAWSFCLAVLIFFSMLQIIFNLYKTITNDITVYFWLRALYYKISAIIAICFRIITAVFLLWSLNLVWTQMFYFVSFVLFFLYMFYLCVIFSKNNLYPYKIQILCCDM